MSCIVNRNKEGKIVSVNAKNGQSSELFKAIHGNIFMADADTSVKALSKIYTPQIEKMFEGAKKHVYDTGEPMVFYSNSRGGEYTSLEEVLLDENIGEVTMGFKNPNTDTFIPVLKFNATGSDRSEFLTSMVQQGFLSAERELGSDGVTRFVGKGSFPQEKLMGAKGARFEALMNGNGRTKLNSDGTLEIDFMDGYTTMIVDGQQKVIRIDNVRQELQENPTAENKVELLALKAFRDIKLFPNQKKQTDPKEVKRIERAVWNFLERMGFSVTTLENYRKNYNTKYGKDPDINAIADLANKVVAIAEGRDMSGEFIEEVAHIAIEAYSEQNSIVSALANVHLTPEYNQHQAFYREKYAPFYKGVALEEQVRREVMGKILAQEIASQFENIGRSEERDTLLEKLANIWDKFVGYVRSRFGAYEVAAIRDLNRRIAESILKEDQMSFQEAFESDNFYYNAQPTESRRIESHLREVKAVLENLFYNQLKETIPDKATLDRVRDDMETVEVMSSVNAITGVAEKLLTTVGLNVKDLNEKIARTGVKEPVSVNDFISFSVVKDNVLPSLESMRDSLEKLDLEPELESTRSQIVERIKSVRDNVGNLSPKIEKDASDMIDQLYKGILDQSELTDDEKQRLMQHLDAGLKDVSFMANLFGIATNSSNPIVTLVAHLSQQMNINTAEIVNNEVNPLLRRLTEKNLERFQKRIIQRDSDGKATYYYISPIRYDLYEKDLEDFKVKTLAEVSGKKIEEVQELREKRVHERTIAGSPENYTKFTDALRDYNRASTESMFNDSYYAERDKVFSEIDASDYTKAWLRNFSTVRSEMRSSYPAEAFVGNRLDKTKLTSAQRQKEYDAAKMRRKAAEAYNEFGDIKDGLQVVSTKGLTVQQKSELKDRYNLPYEIDEDFGGDITVLAEGRTIENLTDESRLALDLFNYNMFLRSQREKEQTKRGPSEDFKSKLREFTNPVEAYEWAITNGSFNLNDEFYDQLSASKTFLERARAFSEQVEDDVLRERMESLLDDIESLQRQKRSLLKQNRSVGSPLETDVYNMPEQVRKRIIEIEEKLAENKRRLNLPQEFYDIESDVMVETEVVLTEQFDKMLKDAGERDPLKFMFQHMSNSNTERVWAFKTYIADALSGRAVVHNLSFERFLEGMLESGDFQNIMEQGSRAQAIDYLTLEFAKRNVASYFQRFEPKGYSKLVRELEAGEISIVDLIEGRIDNDAAQYVELIPDFLWQEDIDTSANNNPNYKGGQEFFLQPKWEKYKNKEFFDRYGISERAFMDLKDGDISKLTPTRNVEEFQFLTEMIELKKKTLRLYGEQRNSNPYLRAQVGFDAFTLEGGARTVSGRFKSNAKNLITEISTNRVDQKEYGEQVDGEDIFNPDLGIKVIPKYYLNKMADPSKLTDNVLEAEVKMFQQAALYSQRKVFEKDFRALEWKSANQKLYKSGVSKKLAKIPQNGSTSNYHKWTKEIIDYQLYGIKQTLAMKTEIFGREIDITNMFNKIQAFTRFSNLAFNPFVDLTSGTTGVVTNITDRLAKDYYAPSSANRSNSQTGLFSSDYVLEASKLNKESKLNHLGEWLGLMDFESKVKDSAFNRGMRFLGRTPYALSKFMNLPIHQRNMLAVLNDYRLIDGKFIDYPNFRLQQKRKDKKVSEREIQAMFDRYKNDSAYDFLEITKDGVKYNSRFEQVFGERAQEEFRNLRNRASNKAQQVIERADGVLNKVDQVGAQRNVLTNALMMHKGWLPILLTRRFKARQFNIQLGKMEEGHYITLLQTLPGKIRETGGFWKALEELDPDQRANLQRIGWELGIFATIMLLGMAVLAADDGEDDSYIEELARLVYLRTASEYSTTQLFSVPSVMVDVVKSPVVAVRTLDAIEPVSLISDMFKDVASIGDGEDSKTLKKLRKNSFLKRYDQLSDLQQQVDAYRHFNRSTLYWLSDEK